MNKLTQSLKDIFYPPRCVFCDEVISILERPICPVCLKAEIPVVPDTICSRCGRGKEDCTCKLTTFLTDGIAAPYYYEGVAAQGILHFKRAEDIDRIGYFTKKLAERAFLIFADTRIDLITTVPPHISTMVNRGFDQMYPVAKRLSKVFHTPYKQVLRKIFPTESQKELDADRRSGNLLGVFDVCEKQEVVGKNILLLDDVVTTGATTNECAKMLKIYGANNVYVLAVAISRPDQDEKEDENDPIVELKRRLAGKAGDFT